MAKIILPPLPLWYSGHDWSILKFPPQTSASMKQHMWGPNDAKEKTFYHKNIIQIIGNAVSIKFQHWRWREPEPLTTSFIIYDEYETRFRYSWKVVEYGMLYVPEYVDGCIQKWVPHYEEHIISAYTLGVQPASLQFNLDNALITHDDIQPQAETGYIARQLVRYITADQKAELIKTTLLEGTSPARVLLNYMI